MKQILNAILILFFCACGRKMNASGDKGIGTIDKNATAETKALFRNLKQLSANHTLFGHQHAIEYGHGWAGDADRSDVKSVTGSHPAVIGVDISGLPGSRRRV